MNAAEIFRKLRLEGTKKILVINAPIDYENILSGLIYDKDYNENDENSFDFVQVFATSQSELDHLIKKVGKAGKYDCLFWICYPKGGGKIKSDLKRDLIWNAFAIANLRPVSQIAIDDTWSALRGRPNEVVGK